MISEIARLFLYTVLLRLPSVLFLLSVCVKQYVHHIVYSAAGEIIKNVLMVEGKHKGGVVERQKPDDFLRLFS